LSLFSLQSATCGGSHRSKPLQPSFKSRSYRLDTLQRVQHMLERGCCRQGRCTIFHSTLGHSGRVGNIQPQQIPARRWEKSNASRSRVTESPAHRLRRCVQVLTASEKVSLVSAGGQWARLPRRFRMYSQGSRSVVGAPKGRYPATDRRRVYDHAGHGERALGLRTYPVGYANQAVKANKMVIVGCTRSPAP
jgi:hypothetical protein